jgi:hypothetical protein
MPGKMARSDPRPPFELLEVKVAVRTSRLFCRKAGKTRIFSPVQESSGESRCRSATWLYNRDGGDLYVCDASSVFYFLNNVFQREMGRKASCRKTASLDSPQRVDSRSEIPMSVQHQADHPIPIGSNHYWYADTQGNVGVCVFIGITLPEPTYPFTTLGSKFCIKAPIT